MKKLIIVSLLALVGCKASSDSYTDWVRHHRSRCWGMDALVSFENIEQTTIVCYRATQYVVEPRLLFRETFAQPVDPTK